MDFEDENVQAFLQAAIDDHGFLSWLDVQVEEVGEGSVELRVPHDDRLTNMGPTNRGEVHGGVAATLVDTAGGLACRTALDNPASDGVVSINMDVSYLRAALGDLQARAEVVRAGGTIGVADVTVESETATAGFAPVVVGRGSYRLFRETER
jgi:uncharacterized protein (TIGR00369 family)